MLKAMMLKADTISYNTRIKACAELCQMANTISYSTAIKACAFRHWMPMMLTVAVRADTISYSTVINARGKRVMRQTPSGRSALFAPKWMVLKPILKIGCENAMGFFKSIVKHNGFNPQQ